ncbi:MAG TPA: tRNA preQ1(34) S-adenosylmethionine ribosyltransferase-isomerase QueA [Myxococcaceae bacterium]|nr:tRNA preQ1(34) S-adenosylmethionine ribosyltransferase-isomerase QueA [Myxococcaceae bacterium]
MALADYDYALPPEAIAQFPLPERDASRLLVLDRRTGRVAHRGISELPELLRPGDLLVLNESRVIPARLVGRKRMTGGRAELLLVHPADGTPVATALAEPPAAHPWLCLGQASKGLTPGVELGFGEALTARVEERLGEGEFRVVFDGPGTLGERVAAAGLLPLPPYISRPPTADDAERYQTIYARVPGSVAAPTAGLHLTPRLLERLAGRGITTARLTLDVGPGTFLPVRSPDESLHRMHPEPFDIPGATAAAIGRARAEGRRVVAVGTTVVRALESTAARGPVLAGAGRTDLFIRPGHRFRAVDALLTNFHLPRSTLLMLVSAFAGREQVLAAYRTAVEAGYRFFSYGDAMLVEDGR